MNLIHPAPAYSLSRNTAEGADPRTTIRGEVGQREPKTPIFPLVPEPLPLTRFSAADDLRAAIGLWVAWLAGERRASAHTVAAYGRDLAFFLDFLTGHLGEAPSLAAIDALRPADFRAYLARRAGEGIERSSLARSLSVLRGFVRFLRRRGLASTTALAALRGPKLPPAVPKPLSIDDAIATIDTAGELPREAWQGRRDTALLALIYGCGLRLSEALGLSRAEAPVSELLTIVGKGRKERQLPVLPAVRAAIADYLATCPYRLSRGGSALCRRPRRPVASAPGAAADGGSARASRTAGDGEPARAAPQLCDAPVGSGRRSARDPGIAGPCQPVDDAALHVGRDRAAAGRLRQCASARPAAALRHGGHGRRR